MKQSSFRCIPATAMRPRPNPAAILCLMAVLFSTLPSAWGQTIFGRITGSVTDPSGASISGAKVTVTGVETQSSRTATTDANGLYAVTNLAIGHYKVAV